ncbi:hypothetical protein [Cohnella sp. REN36]|uniref:hypothetical protein n=1 Tax=Cohnella sp. REN36 TaxID=2887347 RepID=UPI001D13B812|nr:hypothetical protein [Cohnella sp. REN36]MCC3376209.1 hypothetical protein [Cohnella sp. REN36]
MAPWLTIVVAGAAIAGYGWLLPRAKPQEREASDEQAYDLLLSELETENRELVDAVATFKQEQDETVARLGRRILELEKQMTAQGEQLAAASLEARESPARREETVPASEPQSPKPMVAAEPEVTAAEAVGARGETVATERPAAVAAESAPVSAPQTSMRGRYGELLDLHDRGRSVEQIAKAMNMNKGEVQLILQLARREEERHAQKS